MPTSKSEFEIEVSVSVFKKSQTKHISIRAWNKDDWRHQFNGCFDVTVDLHTGELTVKEELWGEDGPGCHSLLIPASKAVGVINFFELDELI